MRTFLSWSLVVIGCADPSGAPDAGTTSSDDLGDDLGTDASTRGQVSGDAATSSPHDGSGGSEASDASSGAADDDDTGPPLDPPDCGALRGLPSAPGPHIAEITALADDTWIDIGPPAADPVYGKARGRSWGGRAFALAPDLRGAFFAGEGLHGYVKPDGFGQDDVFFYDLNAHAWIAIHPGVDTLHFNQQVADGELSIDANGQLVDAAGHQVPLHVLIHAWGFLDYDPHTRRFAMLAGDGMGRYYMPGEEAIDEGLTVLEGMKAGLTVPAMSPWLYSPIECRWERYAVPSGPPLDSLMTSFPSFVYATASQRYVVAGAQGIWEFDPGDGRANGSWSEVPDTGPRPSGYDLGTAYDPTRNRIYVGGGSGDPSPGLFIYDIDRATWTYPSASGVLPVDVGSNSASMFYDHVADVVTVFHYVDGTHYTYDPEAEAWTDQPLLDGALEVATYPSWNAFYDPELAAYFIHGEMDSQDDGNMWVYRYQGNAR